MTKMLLKFTTLLFAFIATACSAPVENKTTVYEDIVRIIRNNCQMDMTRFTPLKLEETCSGIVGTGNTPPHILCNIARKVMIEGCDPVNKSSLITALENSDFRTMGIHDFCKNPGVLEVLSKYLKPLGASSRCEKICDFVLEDQLLPVCPFIVSYHKLQLPPKTIPSAPTNRTSEQQSEPEKPKESAHSPSDPEAASAAANLKKIVNSGSSLPAAPISTETRGSQSLVSNNTEAKDSQQPLAPVISNNALGGADEALQETRKGSKATPEVSDVLPVDEETINNKKVVSGSDDGNEGNNGGVEESNIDDNKEPIVDSHIPILPGDTDQNNENGEKKVESKPITEEISQNSNPIPEEPPQNEAILKSEPFVESESSNFFAYFVFISALCIFFYVAMYNKKKFLALMIEGRRTSVKRRPNSAAYSKLNCNLEEAMASGPSTSSTNTLLY